MKETSKEINLQIIADILNTTMKRRNVNVVYSITNRSSSPGKTIVGQGEGVKVYIEDDNTLSEIYDKSLTVIEFNEIVNRHLYILRSNLP